MTEKEKEELTKKAIEELGIDKPIMATRMVGGKLELFLYGGEVASYQPAGVVEKAKKRVTRKRKAS